MSFQYIQYMFNTSNVLNIYNQCICTYFYTKIRTNPHAVTYILKRHTNIHYNNDIPIYYLIVI